MREALVHGPGEGKKEGRKHHCNLHVGHNAEDTSSQKRKVSGPSSYHRDRGSLDDEPQDGTFQWDPVECFETVPDEGFELFE